MAKTISFDYDSIKQRIINVLSSKTEWASFLSYGVTDNIISAIAQEFAYEMQGVEYYAFENFWSKARNKSSLLVQSTVHGYKVPRKRGATGTLRVSTSKNFDTPYEEGLDISIPRFFQFSGNDITVVADSDSATGDSYTLLGIDPYVDIVCKQGSYKYAQYTSNGDTYETYTIIDDSVDNDFFELYVNGVKWKEVDSLFLCKSNDQVYQIKTLSDLSGIVICFGNGIFGQKPNNGDVILFKYISTLGTEGNVYDVNGINKVETQAFDSKGNAVDLYVTNLTSILGGVDYPTIEEIRDISPKVYQSGNRASNIEDYETIIRQLSYISKIEIWGAYEYFKDNNKDLWDFIPSEENVVHIACLNSEFNEVSNDEKTQIIEDIHSLCDPTDLISFETVNKVPLVFDVDATVLNSSYSLIQVRANIENALKKDYDIANMEFNKNIYISDYIRTIDECEGVDHHQTQVHAKFEECAFSSYSAGTYSAEFYLPLHPIIYNSVSIYIENITDKEPSYQLVATCDENGNLIGEEGFSISGSQINLSTGITVFIVRSGLTDSDYTHYRIKCLYKSENDDLIANSRSTILYYDSANISLTYK